MVKLYENGVFVLNGKHIIEDGPMGCMVGNYLMSMGINASKQDAQQGTMAYNILKNHNTSDSMDKLKIEYI